jgi:hypothetical protein
MTNERSVVHRFVSILTIVALLFCTVSCASGVCCVARDAESAAATEVERCCKCCASHESSSDTPGSDEQPLQEPCRCQGVCAGAIVEKADTLPTAITHCCFLPTIVESHLLLRPANGCQRLYVNDLLESCRGGRNLRFHLCSLTC